MMAQASDGKGQRPGYGEAAGRETLQPDFDAELRARIGRGLKNECEMAITEPLPPRLLKLLGELERASPAHGDAGGDDPYR
ncbi:hypothetical protein WDZ92_50985, partial [Nostoc sp. NIES-2111]